MDLAILWRHFPISSSSDGCSLFAGNYILKWSVQNYFCMIYRMHSVLVTRFQATGVMTVCMVFHPRAVDWQGACDRVNPRSRAQNLGDFSQCHTSCDQTVDLIFQLGCLRTKRLTRWCMAGSVVWMCAPIGQQHNRTVTAIG
jgi:hypothetical protein